MLILFVAIGCAFVIYNGPVYETDSRNFNNRDTGINRMEIKFEKIFMLFLSLLLIFASLIIFYQRFVAFYLVWRAFLFVCDINTQHHNCQTIKNKIIQNIKQKSLCQ